MRTVLGPVGFFGAANAQTFVPIATAARTNELNSVLPFREGAHPHTCKYELELKNIGAEMIADQAPASSARS